MSKKGPREGAYVKSNDASANREERMTRLKFELRQHIRFLSDYEVLSSDWLRMAESLHQIANVAFMETHLPPSENNPLTQQGKKTSGTLWDQERDELAVRILLEEGKLNLALRILKKYKTMQRTDEFDQRLKETCKQFNSDPSTVIERCRVFEQSLGVLLKYAFGHIEAMQIMDVPEFVEHIRELLVHIEASNANVRETDKMQDTLVVHYLASLALKLEEMDEDRVMDLLENNKIFPLFLNHMIKHFKSYKLDTLEASVVFLSNCMRSDGFNTEPTRFLPNDVETKKVVNLKGLYIQLLVEKFGTKKSDIQTLWDNLEKYEATFGKCTVVPFTPITKV